MRLAKIIIAIACFSQNALCQCVNYRTVNYSKADSIALNLPKTKHATYKEVAALLTVNLKSDQEKFRAIFRWITDNIKYNYNRTDDATKVFKAKKSACIGYATLLQNMCEAANLDCEVIEGWSKIEPSEIGQRMTKTSHAWNAIELGGKWYLTDVTWAASYYDPVKRRIVKHFDTSYFCQAPKLL